MFARTERGDLRNWFARSSVCRRNEPEFSEARRQGFSPGTPVSSPPSSVNGSAYKVKFK